MSLNFKLDVVDTTPHEIKRLFPFILVGVTLLFRLPVLFFNDSIRLDEGFSLRFIEADLDEIIIHATRDSHSPFYTIILKGWCLLAGTGEISVRFLSLLFGITAVLSLYQLGRMLYGEKAGFAAAGLAAISPLWTWYSVEARMYTIWLTFICINTIFFFSLIKHPTLRAMFGYALSASLVIYTQYIGLLVLGLHFSLLVFTWKRNKKLVWWLAQAYTLTALTFVPWITAIFLFSEDFPSDKLPPPTLIEMYRMVIQVFFGYITDLRVYRVIEPVLVLATIIFLIFTITVFIPATLSSNKVKAYTKVFLIMPLLVILAFFGFSIFISIMEVRYILFLTPFIYLLLGNLLVSSERKFTPRRVIYLSLVVIFFGALTFFQTIDPANMERVDYRGVADYVTSHVKQGDRIVLDAYFIEPAFNYYYGDLSIVPIIAAPASHEIAEEGPGLIENRLNPPSNTRIIWVVQSYWERPQSPTLNYYSNKYPVVEYIVFSPELRLWGFWAQGG